jgi:hypothetical protein
METFESGNEDEDLTNEGGHNQCWVKVMEGQIIPNVIQEEALLGQFLTVGHA